MAVPTTMQNLSLTAASNSPAGTDAIGNTLDDYLRAHAAIVRSIYSLASSAIASASTVDVASADGESVSITGTTTINSLGTGYAGCVRELRFAGALTLTHSASLNLGGSNFATQAGDALRFRCTAAGTWLLVGGNRISLANAALTGTPTTNGIEIGYRGVPLTSTNSNYVFVAGDAGQGHCKTGTGAYSWMVPSGVFATGDVLTVLNAGTSAGNLTITQGVGMTLYLAGMGTTGSRTVVPTGVATIYFLSSATAFIAGSGVS